MNRLNLATSRQRISKDGARSDYATRDTGERPPRTRRFVLIGAAGYIAQRHMKAIKDTGGELVAALDKSDAVGIMDSYFPHAEFFTEFERFDRHIDKLQRDSSQRIDYVSICSPNYLHDAHIRFALRIGADAICEKPVVLNPWNVEALRKVSAETGRNVCVILQLRLHPAIRRLKNYADTLPKGKRLDIDLTYVTPRGPWYMTSWKGDVSKSGGITTNIGVHFFDVLNWIFGELRESVVHLAEGKRSAGMLEFDKARVRWFLSVDEKDLPPMVGSRRMKAWRTLTVDGRELAFSDGFEDLHTASYRAILDGKGFTLEDAKAAIEIVAQIRSTEPIGMKGYYHPILRANFRQTHAERPGWVREPSDDIAQPARRFCCVQR